jgi:PST family polysaccharide transporter
MLTSIVVARSLGPEPYGVFAIANLLLGFTVLFRDLGFSPAIITGRLSEPIELDSAHWLLVCIGGGLALISAAAAPLIALAFASPAVEDVLRVASLSLFAPAWGVVPLARLQRRRQFNLLARISVCQNLAAMVCAISLAWLGYGVWALVLPAIVASALAATLAWMVLGRRPHLNFAWAHLRPHLREGANVTGFSMFNYLTRNADNAIIGRSFGEHALGQYAFAYTLMKRPVNIIAKALGTPLLPMLADLQSDLERCDQAFVRVIGAVLRIAAPPLLMGALLSHLLVPVVFGERWLEAIPLVRILLFLGALQVVGTLFGSLWLSLGQSSLLLRWGIASGTASLPVFALGAWLGGPEGLAIGYALFSAAMLIPTVILTRRYCGLRLAGLASLAARTAVDMAATATAIGAADFSLAHSPSPLWLRLAFDLVVGSTTYVLILKRFRRDELSVLSKALPGRWRQAVARMMGLPT